MRRTLSGLTIGAALLLLYSGGARSWAQPAPKATDPGQDALRREPATQPIYKGLIADADRTMDYSYVIVQEAPEADISVTTQVAPPQLQARGPVIVYIEGRAGRVDAEHVNTYVTGKTGGNRETRFGVIRSAASGNYSVYHFPRSDPEVDVVTVTIVGGASRTLDAGEYIDVVRDPAGVWWFSNHAGTDQGTPWAGARDADVERLKGVAEKAAGI
jgi:hypothetical protein